MRPHGSVCAVLCLLIAGCGYAEWPPREEGPPRPAATQGRAAVAIRAQPRPQTRAAENRDSDLTFVGATAVRVGSGDTVYAIARRHRVSLRSVIDANNLEPPYDLKVGQRVDLPQGRRHRVQPGETLYSIAQRYNVNQYETARLNGVRPPYRINAGEYLVVPEADKAPLTAAAPASPTRPARATAPPIQKTARTAPEPARTVTAPRQIKPTAPPGVFVWPADGRVISGFGVKANGFRNDGINIEAAEGAPVRATQGGVVAYVGNEIRGFGNLVLIKHDGGWISAYAHTDKLRVRRGDRVATGQMIAQIGATGNVARPQLHFELRRNKRPVDPRKHLSRSTG
ncbi:MAG: peptidoglycan DD-metalloendopeptidase family protein [Rhodospirillaceae bacterium]